MMSKPQTFITIDFFRIPDCAVKFAAVEHKTANFGKALPAQPAAPTKTLIDYGYHDYR